MTEAQTEIQELQTKILHATSEYQIKISEWTLNNIIATTEGQRLHNNITEQTSNSIIEKARAEVSNIYAATKLKEAQEKLAKSGIQVNNEQIEKIKNDIKLGIKAAEQRDTENELS